MGFLSSVFLPLLVTLLETGKSTAENCAENGGVCLPFSSVECTVGDGQCPIGETCCQALVIPASCQNFTDIFGLGGEVVVPDNGLITYQDNLYCEWIIEVPFGYWIYVNFTTFDLEGYPSYCPWDYLEFSDASSFPEWYGQKLCGSYDTWFPSFEASTNRIRVVFRSDVSVVKTGFSFNWTAIEIPTTPVYTTPMTPGYTTSCQLNTTLNGNYGVVTIPDNGNPTYWDNQYCEWFIEVPPGLGILINIISFDLEGPYPGCPWDYLQFFSATPYFPWQSGKLCSTIDQIPTNFTVPTNQLKAVFISDSSVVYTGFTFTWTAIEVGTGAFFSYLPTLPTTSEYEGGGTSEIPTTPANTPSCQLNTTLNGNYGVVTIPDNGNPTYWDNQYCEWFIEAPPGFGILINIISFDLEGPYPVCPWDYLQFISATPYFPWQSGKLCSTIDQIPTNFTVPTNQLKAVFISDSSVVYTGFTFTWTAIEVATGTFFSDLSTLPTTSGYEGGVSVIWAQKRGVKAPLKKAAWKDKKTN